MVHPHTAVGRAGRRRRGRALDDDLGRVGAVEGDEGQLDRLHGLRPPARQVRPCHRAGVDLVALPPCVGVHRLDRVLDDGLQACRGVAESGLCHQGPEGVRRGQHRLRGRQRLGRRCDQVLDRAAPHVRRGRTTAVVGIQPGLATEDDAAPRPEDGQEVVVVGMEQVAFGEGVLALARAALKVVLPGAGVLVEDARPRLDPEADLVELAAADQERPPVVQGCHGHHADPPLAPGAAGRHASRRRRQRRP